MFSGLSGKKVISAGLYRTYSFLSRLYYNLSSAQNSAGFKCSYKANEAFLFPLDKSFLSIPKPPIFIPHAEIGAVTFSRVGGASSTTKFFEMRISMSNGTEYGFANIPRYLINCIPETNSCREEYNNLYEFCKARKLHVMNEMADEGRSFDIGDYMSDGDGEIQSGSEDDQASRKRSRGVEEEESSGNLSSSSIYYQLRGRGRGFRRKRERQRSQRGV